MQKKTANTKQDNIPSDTLEAILASINELKTAVAGINAEIAKISTAIETQSKNIALHTDEITEAHVEIKKSILSLSTTVSGISIPRKPAPRTVKSAEDGGAPKKAPVKRFTDKKTWWKKNYTSDTDFRDWVKSQFPQVVFKEADYPAVSKKSKAPVEEQRLNAESGYYYIEIMKPENKEIFSSFEKEWYIPAKEKFQSNDTTVEEQLDLEDE